MKRHGVVSHIVFSLLIATAVSSCSLMGPPSGKLSIPFPSAILESNTGLSKNALASRAMLPAGMGAQVVRIYLESRGGLVPLAGSSPVFEAPVPLNGALTIDGLPQLQNCSLYLALSAKGGTDFRAVKFAVSKDPFNIVAGTTTTVDLTVQPSPFQDSFTTSDLRGVRALALGSATYYLANGVLSVFDDAGNQTGTLSIAGTNGITQANGLGAGKVMNSDGSFGADALWICTDRGVWALGGTGSSMGISQLSIKDASGNPLAVGEVDAAGAIPLNYVDNTVTPSVSKAQNVIFYEGPKGTLGGAYSSNGGWGWFDLAANLDQLGSTLKDSITSSDKPIIADYSTDATNDFGYLAVPAINNFRVGGDVVSTINALGQNPKFSDLLNAVLKNNTISLPSVSGAAPLATSVSEVISGTTRTLYVGSDRGVFAIEGIGSDGMLVDSAGTPLAAQPIVLGKAVSVAKLRATINGGHVWIAVLGRGGALYLLKDGGLFKSYPFFSGLPDFGGDAQATGDLSWTTQGLMVSGTNGVVLLTYAQVNQAP